MKKALFSVLFFALVFWSVWVFAEENATVDNRETIKIEKSDGTNIIITGNGDNVVHYNSPEQKEDEKENTTNVVIQQNDNMGAFVVIMSFPVFKYDNLSTTFTELIIPLYFDGTWELLWFEE